MLADGGQSPWLWIVIPAGGVVFYLIDRSVSRRTGRPMRGGIGLGFAPWWQQAIAFGVIGSGMLYNLVTGHQGWFWWLLCAGAWLVVAKAVVTRKP